MATEPTSFSVAKILALVGIGALPLLCCAGPALIAGGALGVLGGALGNPWLIGATAVVVLAAVGYTLRRHGHGKDRACTPPGHPDTSPDSADRRTTP